MGGQAGKAGDGQANIQPLLIQMRMGEEKRRVWALGVQQEPVPLPNGSAVSTKQWLAVFPST